MSRKQKSAFQIATALFAIFYFFFIHQELDLTSLTFGGIILITSLFGLIVAAFYFWVSKNPKTIDKL
ncbi:hypothetical protein [Alteromonas flava]|uniref:hypothetical protein n=1 Tax=Alteromonas flava TaxID=2048003 RepID=UPI000C281A8B|nr:hypothetical protein [Alteromonas flava]